MTDNTFDIELYNKCVNEMDVNLQSYITVDRNNDGVTELDDTQYGGNLKRLTLALINTVVVSLYYQLPLDKSLQISPDFGTFKNDTSSDHLKDVFLMCMTPKIGRAHV